MVTKLAIGVLSMFPWCGSVLALTKSGRLIDCTTQFYNNEGPHDRRTQAENLQPHLELVSDIAATQQRLIAGQLSVRTLL